MGNPKRFKRLLYMVPSTWFYKLKDMNNRATTRTSTAISNSSSTTSTLPSAHVPTHARKSYHFYRDIVDPDLDPPRMSSKHTRAPSRSSKPKAPSKHTALSLFPNPPASNSSASFGCSSPEFRLDRVLTPELRGSSNKTDPTIADDHDVIIYMDENSVVAKPKKPVLRQNNNPDSTIDLPRIITKPKHGYGDQGTKKPSKKVRENISGSRKSVSRRYSLSTSPRLRLKINSPRLGLASRIPVQARKKDSYSECSSSSSPSGRRKLSGSFAIVKSSFDPKRDFRESMVEMIVEHNIKASRDLEELLACYLSLNSGEYHELIIDVFKQIWFDLTDIDSQLG